MKDRNVLNRHSRRIVALGIVATLFWLSLPPSLSAAERKASLARFHFDRYPLPVPAHARNQLRPVHPSYQSIVSWISSVGAAVALADIDGDGLPNDICYVDTSTDQVIVAPVPGTPQRYQPFALDPTSLTYDSQTMAPMGCLPGHFKEDSSTDLLVYYWGRSPVAFLQQPPTAGVSVHLTAQSFVPREVVNPYQRWYSNTATSADLDGDGHLDLAVGNYFPDGSRVLGTGGSDAQPMTSSLARGFNGGGPHLLRWTASRAGAEPDISYQEVRGAIPDSAAHGWTLAVGAADLEGRLMPDIYLANDFGPDRLLVNWSTPGHLRFSLAEASKGLTTPTSKVLGHDSFKGMGVDFADINQRGLTDMVVSNITSPYALEESNFVFMNTGDVRALRRGSAPFSDQSTALGLARSGWSWDVKLGDFDNRGQQEVLQAVGFLRGSVNRWPELQELAMANQFLVGDPGIWPRFQPGDDLSGHEQNTFFVRAGDGRYMDFGAALGLDQGAASRSIAVADVDGDGRLDFAVANQWSTSYFFHNTSPQPGSYLGLDLLLPVAGQAALTTLVRDGHPDASAQGRPAVGATVTVNLPGGKRVLAMVDGGNGHGGKRSPEVHLGLGDLPAGKPLPVDVAWRDGDGKVRRDTLQLTPGWHTILLASGSGGVPAA